MAKHFGSYNLRSLLDNQAHIRYDDFWTFLPHSDCDKKKISGLHGGLMPYRLLHVVVKIRELGPL